MKLALLSNVTTDFLRAELAAVGFETWTPAGWGQWIPAAVGGDPGLDAFAPEIVLVLLDGRALAEQPELFESARRALDVLAAERPGAWILVSDVDVPPFVCRSWREPSETRKVEAAWNEAVEDLVAERPNACRFPLKELVEDMGRVRFYDARLRYAASQPFALEALRAIAGRVRDLAAAYRGTMRKKVLALDLDGVLWAGTAADEDGLRLGPDSEGRPHLDLQRRVKEIRARGALLVALSKNAEETVERAWSDPRMVLAKEDFAALRINWEAKADNLADVADELGVGVDSFVFIDDRAEEREAMKAMLPAVEVPDFPSDRARLEAFMLDVGRRWFLPVAVTEEGAAKTEVYHARAARAEAARGLTAAEYLATLELDVDAHPARDDEMPRLAELAQKTNQFNVTTRRLTEGELRQLAADEDNMVLAVRVADRFGDHGLTGFVIAWTDGARAEITDFVLSCRVMNLGVEEEVEASVEAELASRGVEELTAVWRRTPKNAPVEDLFERLGFAQTGGNADAKTYRRAIGAPRG